MLGITLGFVVSVTISCSIVYQVQADDSGLAGALHDLGKEKGKICMVNHFHNGTSFDQKSKRKALKEAIKSWEEFTAWEYGSDWGKFLRARSRGQRCNKSEKTWSCSVEARPCRTVNKQYATVK